MARRRERHPLSAAGDWYVDTRCIDCGASRDVARGLIVRRGGQSVFARQPATADDEIAAWRAVLVCPTASVGTESHRPQPPDLFPQQLDGDVYRCGYNARSSFGAHAYFVRRDGGNLMVDSPRFTSRLVSAFESRGGLADILLTHRDDVADAERYAKHFGARVWIHDDDGDAAPYASDRLHGNDPRTIRERLLAIPCPGHTRGSVVFLLDERYLFTGDTLAWSHERGDLVAFRDACWYSWDELRTSLARLAGYGFEWVLAGHGGSAQRPTDEMQRRLHALVARM